MSCDRRLTDADGSSRVPKAPTGLDESVYGPNLQIARVLTISGPLEAL